MKPSLRKNITRTSLDANALLRELAKKLPGMTLNAATQHMIRVGAMMPKSAAGQRRAFRSIGFESQNGRIVAINYFG